MLELIINLCLMNFYIFLTFKMFILQKDNQEQYYHFHF